MKISYAKTFIVVVVIKPNKFFPTFLSISIGIYENKYIIFHL